MRAWACSDAHGVYLSAVCIVFAEDEATARELILHALWDVGLGENQRDTFTLVEVPMTGAYVLWNGDY